MEHSGRVSPAKGLTARPAPTPLSPAPGAPPSKGSSALRTESPTRDPFRRSLQTPSTPPPSLAMRRMLHLQIASNSGHTSEHFRSNHTAPPLARSSSLPLPLTRSTPTSPERPHSTNNIHMTPSLTHTPASPITPTFLNSPKSPMFRSRTGSPPPSPRLRTARNFSVPVGAQTSALAPGGHPRSTSYTPRTPTSPSAASFVSEPYPIQSFSFPSTSSANSSLISNGSLTASGDASSTLTAPRAPSERFMDRPLSSFSSLPSTPTSLRSRSPSISSLETIPDSPDAELAALELDSATAEADKRKRIAAALRAGVIGASPRLAAAGGSDAATKERNRWSVCGAETRSELGMETIWEEAWNGGRGHVAPSDDGDDEMMDDSDTIAESTPIYTVPEDVVEEEDEEEAERAYEKTKRSPSVNDIHPIGEETSKSVEGHDLRRPDTDMLGEELDAMKLEG